MNERDMQFAQLWINKDPFVELATTNRELVKANTVLIDANQSLSAELGRAADRFWYCELTCGLLALLFAFLLAWHLGVRAGTNAAFREAGLNDDD